MRSAAYLLVGLVLILIQGTAHRFLSGLEGVTLFGWNMGALLHGATPSLILPFVVYLGIHEHSMARGALLSFALGWGVDILGGGPAFLFRFTMVAIYAISRAASTRVSAQTFMMRIPIAMAASLIESAIVLALLAVFGADNRRPVELSSIVLPRAIATAIFAPMLFSVAHRLLIETRGTAGAASPAGRK